MPDTKFNLEDSLGFYVNRAAMKLKNELARIIKAEGHDITPEQWAVLMHLWEHEADTQTEIAIRLFKDKTNLTRILDGMVKKGLVERRTHENDRRSYRIVLTKRGRELRDELTPIGARVNNAATRGLSDRDKKSLKRLMNAITDNLG